MGLKSFFAKLLGKTDDVAKLAATYGDDVAEGVVRYGDDVSGLVADNAGRAAMSPELLSDNFLDAVDDYTNHTSRFVNIPESLGKGTPYEGGVIVSPDDPLWKYGDDIVDDDFFPSFDKSIAYVGDKPFTFAEGTGSQALLKNSLLSKYQNPVDDVRDVVDNPFLRKQPSVMWSEWDEPYLDSDEVFHFPAQTNYLGDVLVDNGSIDSGLSYDFLRLKNPIDTSQLVVQSPTYGAVQMGGDVGLRPHNNTALGRWFRKKMPNYGIELDLDTF